MAIMNYDNGSLIHEKTEADLKRMFFIDAFEQFGAVCDTLLELAKLNKAMHENLSATAKSKVGEWPELDEAVTALENLKQKHAEVKNEIERLESQQTVVEPVVMSLAELEAKEKAELAEREAAELAEIKAGKS